MAQNDNRNKNLPNNNPGQIVPLDQDTIRTFVQNQTLDLQNQKLDKEIRLKEIEANTKLGEKSLDIQANVLNNRGKDIRQTFTRFGIIGGAFLIIILSFLGFCLWAGKDQFAYKFCQGVGYIITTVLGYYFGQKSVKKESPNSSSTEQEF